MDRNDQKFFFFESYHRALSRATDERYGRIVRAISEYIFSGQDPVFSDDADWMIWELIKPILEKGMSLSGIRREANKKRKSRGNQHTKAERQGASNLQQTATNLQQTATKTRIVAEHLQQTATDKEKEEDMDKDKDLSDTNVSLSFYDAQGDCGLNPLLVLQYFNQRMQGKAIPVIERMTPKRKNVVKAREAEYGKDAIKSVIDNAADSSFLNGGGDNGFVASFDWLFRPNNFPKVLEGNYANRQPHKKTYNGSGATAEERLNDAANLIMQLRQEGVECDDEAEI